MRVGVIDIGTNTILLLVAEVLGDGRVNPILELQEIPRLGKSVDARRYLSQEAMQRSAKIIERFAHSVCLGVLTNTYLSSKSHCGDRSGRN